MRLKRILLLGCQGQVGLALQRSAPTHFEILTPSSKDCNFYQPTEMQTVIRESKPDLILNAAAYTAVDRAEEEVWQAYQCNAKAVRALGLLCEELSIPLFHLSTDYIFSGMDPHPYKEQDTASPINVYGWTKWAGEQQLREVAERTLVLRVSGVFSEHRHNFVKAIVRRARQQQALRVVSDQRTRPTPASALARTLWQLAETAFDPRFPFGTYHYTGDSVVSWYDFARVILEECRTQFGLQSTMTPIPSSEYPTPASRPKNAVLSIQKIQDTFSLVPASWHDELVCLLPSIYQEA